ncbi:hypothetical protein PS689_05489 [Pseudomonas fluorescens]|nr:hypothetical protein PS689_05489 [Pseudomonas fluorescens]
MIEARLLSRLGQNQFAWGITYKNRCTGQAVGNGRTPLGRHREAGLTILVVSPEHTLIVQLQAVGERMAPAVAQTAIDFDCARPVQACPFEIQESAELTVGEGQKLFPCDH